MQRFLQTGGAGGGRPKRPRLAPAAGGGRRGGSSAALVACPACGRQVPSATINHHLDVDCRPAPPPGPSPPARAGAEARAEFLFPGFVSEEEEARILDLLEAPSQPAWRDSTFNGVHRGKAWGVRCDLRARRTLPGHPGTEDLPPFLRSLADRMREAPPLRNFRPNEANAIEYVRAEGHYLGSHVDDRQLSTEVICTLSLAGAATMTFRREGGRPHAVRVRLPRRALQVLTRESRYGYSHGILAEDFHEPRRVSVTFRCSPLTVTAAA